MSKETALWLNTNTLVGFTDKRSTNAWHYRADLQTVDPITGHVGNHYPGAIPVDHVQRRLFGWQAESVALAAYNEDGTVSPLDGWQGIRHSVTGQVFKIFSESYVSHQYNEWLLGTVATLLDDDLAIGSAGLLKGGARAWVSVEVPDTITTPEGVAFRPNLLACTSHDGTLATTFKRVVTVTVCDNTLSAALGESGQVFKVRHSRNSGARITDARSALAIVHSDGESFAAEVKALCETEVTDRQWAAFLDAYVPVPRPDESSKAKVTIAENKRDAIVRLWTSDIRVQPWAGTAFGVLQAANTWLTHESTMRGAAARAERNMINILTDKTQNSDADALKTLNRVLVNA